MKLDMDKLSAKLDTHPLFKEDEYQLTDWLNDETKYNVSDTLQA